MANEYPFKWEELTEEGAKERGKLFKEFSVENPVVRSVPGNVYMPKKFTRIAEAVYNLEVRPDDIWIVTYPKCGTTWTQEMVWQVVNGVDLDPDRPSFMMRSPFIEVSCLNAFPLVSPEDPVPEDMAKMFKERDPKTDPRVLLNSVEYVKSMKGPRVMKSHLPLEMLPPGVLDKAKVIYVCRDPRDVCVSYFHHCHLFGFMYQFQGEFNDYAELFMKGALNYGDYFHHLKGAWEKRNHKNLMFLWFEDMKKDLIKVIQDVSKFTGHHLTMYKTLILDDALYVDNFRKMSIEDKVTPEDKEMFGKFVRKGKVGDYKSLIKGDLEAKFKKWIEENTEGTDLPKFAGM